MPDEVVDLFLCRYIYHCTPSELAKQDAEEIQKHLVLLDVGAKAEERSRNAASAPSQGDDSVSTTEFE